MNAHGSDVAVSRLCSVGGGRLWFLPAGIWLWWSATLGHEDMCHVLDMMGQQGRKSTLGPGHHGSPAQLWVGYSPLLLCLSHCCFDSALQQSSLYPNTPGTRLKQIPAENIFKVRGDQNRPTVSSISECVEEVEPSSDAGGDVNGTSTGRSF